MKREQQCGVPQGSILETLQFLIVFITHPQCYVLSVVAGKVQYTLCGHGKACVLGET